jgi:phage-related protein
MMVLTEITHGTKFHVYALGTDSNPPFQTFADEAERAMPNEWPKLVRLIDQTKDCGPIYNEKQSKKLNGYDFYEFITKGGLRLFYFFDAGRMLICTTGYIKQSNHTPHRELDKADDWRKRYFAA